MAVSEIKYNDETSREKVCNMKDAEIRKLSIRRLTAIAEKEELAVEKIKKEIEESIEEKAKPFYKDSSIIRLFIAGVSLSLILAAYIQYIFVPTQNRLTQKAETAEFTIQQNTARHSAQIAKLELIQEQIKADAKLAANQLKAAISSLEEARKQNNQLHKNLKSLSKEVSEKEEIVKIKSSVVENEEKIERQIAQAKESEVKVAGISEATEAITASSPSKKGWIYIGYYPNEQWQYQTIEIEIGKPKVGETYLIKQNVNIRDSAPRFSILGYKFGNALGFLLPGQMVRVIDVDTVGLNKVWAEIEAVKK